MVRLLDIKVLEGGESSYEVAILVKKGMLMEEGKVLLEDSSRPVEDKPKQLPAFKQESYRSIL